MDRALLPFDERFDQGPSLMEFSLEVLLKSGVNHASAMTAFSSFFRQTMRLNGKVDAVAIPKELLFRRSSREIVAGLRSRRVAMVRRLSPLLWYCAIRPRSSMVR